MKLELGPILYAGESDANRWRFFVNVLFQGGDARTPPPVRVTSPDTGVDIGKPVLAADLSTAGGRYVWRWPVSVGRADGYRSISYRLEATGATVEGLPGESFSGVVIPRRGALPRLAFFSCNGVSSEKQFHRLENPEALWQRMMEVHRKAQASPTPDHPAGFSLLVGGGDQIYADSLWDEEPLHALGRLSEKDRIRQRATPQFVADVRRQFVELYAKRWSYPWIRQAMATIPGVYTWDDHDIFDGWGSHSDALQASPCYRAVFDAAMRAFEAFQVGGTRAAGNRCVGDGSHFLQAVSFREEGRSLDLLLLDLRRDRTRDRVLSERQWANLKSWLDAQASSAGAARTPRHLVVVSSIPVVYMRFPGVIDHLGPLSDLKGIEDDRIDQWEHGRHRGERSRLIMHLLAHAGRTGSQVTILSGDVHVAARARIVSTAPGHVPQGKPRTVIHQVTSSGIVNPPPSALEMKAMTLLSSDARENLSDDVYTETLEVTEGRRYLRARNWLAAGTDEPPPVGQPAAGTPARLWMQWMSEEGPIEPQVVVEP